MNKPLLGISFDISGKSTGVVRWHNQTPVEVENITRLNPQDLGLGELLFNWEMYLQELFGYYVDRRPLPPTCDLAWLAFEDVRAVSKYHGQIQFGMAGALHRHAYRWQVPIFGFAQATVKKALTGTGKADKEMMVNIARSKYPHLSIPNHDVADAIGVGLAFLATQDE